MAYASGSCFCGGARFVCAPWANLWSDEQKTHIRLHAGVRLPHKLKLNNQTVCSKCGRLMEGKRSEVKKEREERIKKHADAFEITGNLGDLISS